MNPPIGYEYPEVGELIDESFLYLSDKETWKPTNLCSTDNVTVDISFGISFGIYCRPIKKNKELFVITANRFHDGSFGRVIVIVDSKQAGERYIVTSNPSAVFNESDDMWEDHKARVWYKIIPTNYLPSND